MYKTAVLLLLLISFCYAQPGQPTGVANLHEMSTRIFAGVSDDTIGSITTPDSVYAQIFDSSTEWQLLSQVMADGDTAMITSDDKIAENSVLFLLANESWWTQTPQIRFQIRNTGQDTCTSNWIPIGKLVGAITLNVKADTVGTYVDYNASVLSGN